MDAKIIPIIIGVGVVVGGGAFYGGMKYDQSQTAFARTAARVQFGGGAFAGGAGANGRGVRGSTGGGFVSGEVLSKDDKSITIKLRNGGSQIVFLSGTTEVSKSTQGSAQDLSVGTQVSANGTANSDGSVTAQMIQIRPTAPAGAQPQ